MMKTMIRLMSLLMALCLMAMPVLAEEWEDGEDWDAEYEWEYEDGNPPVLPTIELKSNPSTGYSWFFECDEPEVLEVVEHGFYSDNEELVGAPGMECFRLDACETGMANVTFSYARSQQEEPLYTIVYQVQVLDTMDVCIFQTSFEMN